MRKLILLALVTFSFLASARTSKIDVPWPECNPCPFVR
jgi:hypothetical protein